ncbi:unnamed protein product [Closterium sp. Naga37s-1]|nr:unnamed protein product [Closterium sp. Naga37s-1]
MAKEGELECKASFTIDMWTAPSGKAWLVVTGRWIDETFQLRTAVLEFREMLRRHTGEEMAQVVEEMVVQWRLQGRCLGLTTDNASSNIAAFRRLSEEGGGLCFFNTSMHFRAMHHTPSIAIAAVCHSQVLGTRDQTCSAGSAGCEDHPQAVEDPESHGHVDRIGLSKDDKKKVKKMRLTDADWERLQAVKTFLSPFAKVSKAAEGAAYPTVSMVVP